MINLTPHTVTVRDESGVDHVFPPSGLVARVEMTTEDGAALEDGTPTCRVKYGKATLPEIELPPGVSKVISSYYGSHRERGDDDEFIHVKAADNAQITAQHGSVSREVIVDGHRYEDDECDEVVVDIYHHVIVSTMFADAYERQARDAREPVSLFVPDSGPTAIRENGQIVAVRRLIRR